VCFKKIGYSGVIPPLFDGCLLLDTIDDYAEAKDHLELDVGVGESNGVTIEAHLYDTGIERQGSVISKPQSYELLAHRVNHWDNCCWKTCGQWEPGFPPVCSFWICVPCRKSNLCIGFNLYVDSGEPFLHNCYCKSPSSPNGWHHVAMVADNTKVRIYLDGEKLGGEEYSGFPWVNSSENLKVGLGLGGAIDEVRISDVARYADLTFTTPAAPFVCDENTRALWHFDETRAKAVYHDSCGIDNILFMNGMEPFPWELFIPAFIKKR
jgi:hypothetical protein